MYFSAVGYCAFGTFISPTFVILQSSPYPVFLFCLPNVDCVMYFAGKLIQGIDSVIGWRFCDILFRKRVQLTRNRHNIPPDSVDYTTKTGGVNGVDESLYGCDYEAVEGEVRGSERIIRIDFNLWR